MGLDSVELVMEVERSFRINIPDAEASKIYTVQDMVNTVAAHLQITDDGTSLRDRMFGKVVQAMEAAAPGMVQYVTIHSKIPASIHPDNISVWEAFLQNLQLKVPVPAKPGNKNRFIKKLIPGIVGDPVYDWHSLSMETLVDAIYARNYGTMRNPGLITRYEIYTTVIEITAEKLGIDYYEITPEKSFTTDLGID